jgi:hypothetical protein
MGLAPHQIMRPHAWDGTCVKIHVQLLFFPANNIASVFPNLVLLWPASGALGEFRRSRRLVDKAVLLYREARSGGSCLASPLISPHPSRLTPRPIFSFFPYSTVVSLPNTRSPNPSCSTSQSFCLSITVTTRYFKPPIRTQANNMHSTTLSAAALLLTGLRVVNAQTFTDCNPLSSSKHRRISLS